MISWWVCEILGAPLIVRGIHWSTRPPRRNGSRVSPWFLKATPNSIPQFQSNFPDTMTERSLHTNTTPELSDPSSSDVAGWVAQAGLPVEAATALLFTELYQELRCLARGKLRFEAADHTLSATGLTHEAYVRLAAQHSTHWQTQGHFLAVAATMMRRILIDHALGRRAEKRQALLVTLSAAEMVPQGSFDGHEEIDALDLHHALSDFERQDARAARVVELRYFGGMELEEVAQALGVSLATVKRDWLVARAWMKRRLGGCR